MDRQHKQQNEAGITRREFVTAAAATGAGLMMGMPAWAQEAPAVGKGDEITIAMIGPGSQGRNLLTKCVKIPGVRFVAICDIWPYNRDYSANILKKYDQPVNTYEDYRDMLAKEKNLDAVIIATPDWMHSEHTVGCLKAGKHVYCEKEMSAVVDDARAMIAAQRESGKLLQIGHQRRSNPRYWHALKLIEKDKVLGQITHVYGQWNRAQPYEVGWPKGKELDADTLKRYGYEDMDHLCNWRWY
ncbi:MAG: Gfo/Idh/MocA family oxidoreductase, partial [Phycisphaerae bacterium]|nr:Gfo/Idh/MocA family oxidoreductase [Phycisphaerae bacterium]